MPEALHSSSSGVISTLDDINILQREVQSDVPLGGKCSLFRRWYLMHIYSL
jgi:hypothetical protein